MSCRAQVGLAERHNPTSPAMAKKTQMSNFAALMGPAWAQSAMLFIAVCARITGARGIFYVQNQASGAKKPLFHRYTVRGNARQACIDKAIRPALHPSLSARKCDAPWQEPRPAARYQIQRRNQGRPRENAVPKLRVLVLQLRLSFVRLRHQHWWCGVWPTSFHAPWHVSLGHDTRQDTAVAPMARLLRTKFEAPGCASNFSQQ